MNENVMNSVVEDQEPEQKIDLVGRYARIRTRGMVQGSSAIYDRVKIVRDIGNLLVVKYVSKSHWDPAKVEYTTETIKKITITELILYKD